MALHAGLLFFKEVSVQHELILSDLCSEQEGEQYVGEKIIEKGKQKKRMKMEMGGNKKEERRKGKE